MRTSTIPKQRLSVSFPKEDMYSIATNDAITLNNIIIPINRQQMYRQSRTAISNAVVPANNPESVSDSP